MEESFVDDMTKEILGYRPSADKQVVIRIHESGDFYDEEYLILWLKIALIVKQEKEKYIFQTYTKSATILNNVMSEKQNRLHDFFREVTGDDKVGDLELKDFGIKIMGSIMDSENESSHFKRRIFEKYGLNIYEAIIVDDEYKGSYKKCDGIQNQCSKCTLCYLQDIDITTCVRKKKYTFLRCKRVRNDSRNHKSGVKV